MRYGQKAEPGKAAVTISREQLRTLFQIFDVDQSGRIDARELTAALRALGVPTRPEQVKQLLAGRTGSGGTVAFDEFCNIAEAQLPERNSMEAYRQTYELFGGSESGYLTVRHLRRVCTELNEDITEEELVQMIGEADSDGDGCVTFDDFVRIMRMKNDPFEDSE